MYRTAAGAQEEGRHRGDLLAPPPPLSHSSSLLHFPRSRAPSHLRLSLDPPTSPLPRPLPSPFVSSSAAQSATLKAVSPRCWDVLLARLQRPRRRLHESGHGRRRAVGGVGGEEAAKMGGVAASEG